MELEDERTREAHRRGSMIGEGEVSERPPLVDLIPRPRCETCRWWERLDSSCGRCRAAGMVRADKRPAALVTGAERLLTAPDFGCVQWEGKGE